MAILLEQFQFPFLSDEIMTEAVVRLFLDETESCSFINAMGSGKDALSPENNLPIACGASKGDTFID
jgi:hypothetical protein